ncbi:MAG: hypothetical protein KTV68_03385 [Acidimicrobiia bacterium]|nr:hypothetical protein [Acidimicrobiia bacterium]MCY4435500.1 hypothetical protein [bacterium]
MAASGPISEGRRLSLMNRLCEVLGDEEGRTLMESLPAVHWHDLATKHDIRASEDRLRTEMNAEFTKVYAEFTKVYAEFKAIRAETAAEFKSVRSEMALQIARQTRTMVFTMLGLAMPTWGAILAVGLA